MANIYSLSDYPNLRRAAYQLHTDSRLQYRTRLKQVAPPASAVVIRAQELPAADGEGHSDCQALLIRLPHDWEPLLEQLASEKPAVVVHPDIGLDAQAAYLSWSLSLPASPLPRAIWLEVARVLEVSAHNRSLGDDGMVPLLLSAGQTFVVTEFSAEPELMQRCQEALQDEAKKPEVGNADVSKARQVAKNYGERPWLFMRYDVRIGGRRVAVNWAALPERLPACVL